MNISMDFQAYVNYLKLNVKLRQAKVVKDCILHDDSDFCINLYQIVCAFCPYAKFSSDFVKATPNRGGSAYKAVVELSI